MTRLTLFTIFGAAFFGAWQYFFYVKCFSWWFDAVRIAKLPFREMLKDPSARLNFAKQMATDLLIHPHLFFPVYYCFKEAICYKPSLVDGRPLPEIVSSALDRYWNNGVDDWLAFWKIWIVGDVIAFSAPLWARLPVNNTISFLYVCVLSYMRGANEECDEGH